MLYTPEYQKQQEKLHAKGNYGVTGQKYGRLVGQIIDKLEINQLLDYGAGSNLSLKETLRPSRPFQYIAYDIGVPELAEPPEPAEMVACIDMLEHSEPDCLEDILDHLEELTEVVLFASVHTGPAAKFLDDGRNAHLIQQPASWWLPKFTERFNLQTFQQVSPVEFYVICNHSALDIEA